MTRKGNKETRSEAARMLSFARRKYAGPPRKADRCACGAMTAKRAKARGHVCSNGQGVTVDQIRAALVAGDDAGVIALARQLCGLEASA